jgi:hypothetical protein
MSDDNSIYDGVEFVAHDLDTMRKQYERLRYDHLLLVKKLLVLEDEVRQWRSEDTRNDWTRYWEEDGIETRLQEAIKATDTLLGDSYFGPAIL